VDRLKFELTRSRQTTTDQADRIEKVKKQNDTLDARLQDMKKSASADQAEIKDLRVKLRMADHERTQLSSKQGEVGETKKALQTLESKRRDEMREGDRKIAELEKALAGEKKKKEGADARLKEIKAKADEEVQNIRQTSRGLRVQVDDARSEARRAQTSLANLEGQAGSKEEDLLSQLEQHRYLLRRVAEEYGRLASVTVPVAEHSRLKHEHTALNLYTLRVERKLANSEAQAVELANLIRHTKEQNEFLSAQLKDTQNAIAFYSQALRDTTDNAAATFATVDRTVDMNVAVLDQELRNTEQMVHKLRIFDIETSLEFYRLTSEQLLLTYSAADKALVTEQQIAQRQTAELSGAVTTRDNLAAQLEAITAEHESVKQLLAAANTALAKAKADTETTAQQMVIVEERMRAEGAKNREALQKVHEAAQRLAATVQITKMSEEGLRAELEEYVLQQLNIAVVIVQVLMMGFIDSQLSLLMLKGIKQRTIASWMRLGHWLIRTF
jgi:predicted  nucleic acid-binding Zn-ribbon protein